MVGQNGAAKTARRKSSRINFFFLDVDGHGLLLHRRIHINLGQDRIVTWCYPLNKRVVYTYTDVKKRRKPAFSTQEVAKMLNRHRNTLEVAINRGLINKPQQTYGLNENRAKPHHKWNEENIIEAHAYLSTKHYGRPRKDGLITPAPLPSLRQLRAMIRQEEPLYRLDENGEFQPVWVAQNFD